MHLGTSALLRRSHLLGSRIALLSMSASQTFVVDPFAFRQFDDPSYAGSRVEYDKDAFAARVEKLHAEGHAPLIDGYGAPLRTTHKCLVHRPNHEAWASLYSRSAFLQALVRSELC